MQEAYRHAEERPPITTTCNKEDTTAGRVIGIELVIKGEVMQKVNKRVCLLKEEARMDVESGEYERRFHFYLFTCHVITKIS